MISVLLDASSNEVAMQSVKRNCSTVNQARSLLLKHIIWCYL